jgi:hypothetical protein
MAQDLFLAPPRIGDDLFEPGRLEKTSFQEEKRPVKRVKSVRCPLDPRVDLPPLNQPLPVAPVAGPVHILVEGSFKAMDDAESLLLEEALGEKSEAQGFQERRAGDQGDAVKNWPSFPFRRLSRSLRLPPVGEEMDFMALGAQSLHELAQVPFGSSVRRIGFANEGDLHKYYSVSVSVSVRGSEKIPISILYSFIVSSLTLSLFTSYIFPEIRL